MKFYGSPGFPGDLIVQYTINGTIMNWKNILCEDRIRQFSKSTSSRDLRTEFEKDYHRIISSAAFRRLQDKTQVFPLDKNDYVRTRLTHSLEVSSFARSLGQSVGQSIINNKLSKDFSYEQRESISDILECAGLIHDIGNPPFGHFGESAIQDWCKNNFVKLTFKEKKIDEILSDEQKNDFYHFEGNAQALRVVSKLHFLVDENGMNLTKALLSTIIKYPVNSTGIDKYSGNIRTKKMGYFDADKDIFENVDASVGSNGNRNPLTYLLEAADDIAYLTADIEDSLKKGMISLDTLILEINKRISKSQNKEAADFAGQCLEKLNKKYEKATDKNLSEPDVYAIENWMVIVQGQVLQLVTDCFVDNYESIMAGTFAKSLIEESKAGLLMNILGDIAFKYTFTSKPIYKLEIAADTILNFLLDKFMKAILYYDTDEKLSVVDKKIISMISRDYMHIYHYYSEGKSESDRLYLRLLLVTDYICGMTDSFAKNLYQEFNGLI